MYMICILYIHTCIYVRTHWLFSLNLQQEKTCSMICTKNEIILPRHSLSYNISIIFMIDHGIFYLKFIFKIVIYCRSNMTTHPPKQKKKQLNYIRNYWLKFTRDIWNVKNREIHQRSLIKVYEGCGLPGRVCRFYINPHCGISCLW
jgi:hypothetical protein